ncbi:hypothetical protein [Bradyrhizobium ivorense]|nr:hypothetical protein [Bradyrhizobium ivorense]VIO73911.1 hypothetical protein CI41S_40200 [Bradyrhizobium ivorense]
MRNKRNMGFALSVFSMIAALLWITTTGPNHTEGCNYTSPHCQR